MNDLCSVDQCGRPVMARSWCNAHYKRWLDHGDIYAHVPVMTMIKGNDEVRFWSQVDFTDTCWLWAGWRSPHNGYGRFYANARTGPAHRWAYEFCVGPIPDGMELDHLCRIRHCVLPDHLEPVTHAENMRRARLMHCKRGHPFTPDNIYHKRRGGRACRSCAITAAREQQIEERCER